MRNLTPSLHAELLDAPAPQPFAGFLQIAWQRKWLVVLGLISGLVIGSSYYVRQVPVFASRAQLLVVKKNADALPIPTADARSDAYDDYLTTHIALIKSPLIVERAVNKRQLGTLPVFAGNADATGAIIGSLSAARDLGDSKDIGSKILNLSFRSASPEVCRTVLEAVIESYKESLDESYRNVGSETVELITKARDVLHKDLAEKEKTYWEFRQKTPLVLKGKDRINLHQERLANIEAKRSALLVHEAELQGHLAAIENALKAGNGQVSKAAILSRLSRSSSIDPGDHNPSIALKEQLVSLLVQEQKLLEDYGKDHPQVQSISKRIALVRSLLEPSTANPTLRLEGSFDLYVQSLKQELNDDRVAADSLLQLFEREHAEAKKLTNYEMQEEMLNSDLKRTQQLYDTILKRLQEVNLVKEAGGYNAQTLWPPSEGAKVGPKLFGILPLAALFGLVGGLGLAYLVDRADNSFRTPDEIRRRLGVPVVGHIPLLVADGDTGSEEGLAVANLDPTLCCHYQSGSIEAEAYRGVRTALYFMSQKEGHRVIQITSPNLADGKTTLIANLALSIAQAGMKCIVLDADLRRPKLHALFGVSNDIGLTSVIASGALLDNCIQDCGVSGLSILACGPLPPNPAEVLMAPSFREVLNVLREDYDYVLIDSPPLLAVTDPGVIAPRVDGVLLVLRLGKNNRACAKRAKEILGSLGARLLGVVVNGISNRGKHKQYSYAHYAQSQAYGYAEYYRS